MNIAYRRMAGSVALSCEEADWTGLWWEPRWALVRELQRRGHQIDFVSPLSHASARAWSSTRIHPRHELLLLEGAHVDGPLGYDACVQTRAIVAAHRGPIIFLADEPTQALDWYAYRGEDFTRWTCWYNTPRQVRLGGQPGGVRVVDMPFGALLPLRPPQVSYRREVAYVGHTASRMTALRRLLDAGIPLAVAAEPDAKATLGKAWVAPPTQPNRNAWWSRYKAAVTLATPLHRRLAWRTSRASEALAAGTPVLAEPEHAGLPWAERPSSYAAMHSLLHELADHAYRTAIWAGQATTHRALHKAALATLDREGL